MASIFTKIIAGEIPSEKVLENEHVVAFKDIYPVAPIHILIVPRKEIPNLQSLKEKDFPLMIAIIKAAQELAKEFGIEDNYRLVTNNGSLAGQSVFHLHFHLIGGQSLGKIG